MRRTPRREEKLEPLTEFRCLIAYALRDWRRTARMCVLVTVITFNWAMAQWLLRH